MVKTNPQNLSVLPKIPELVNKKLTILHILPEWDESSGACHFLSILLKKTTHDNIQHTIASFSNKPVDVDLPITFFSYAELSRWKYSPSFQHYLKLNKNAIDLIHLHGCWIHANFTVYKTNIPYIYKPSGGLQTNAINSGNFLLKWLYYFFIEKKIAKKAFIIHALSNTEKSNLLQMGYSHHQIQILPLIKKIPPNTQLPERYSNQILYIGRIHPIKNLKMLASVAEELEKEGVALNWVIGGNFNSDYARLLIRLFHKKLPKKNFTFPGYLDFKTKKKYFETSTIFIHPSYSENFGHTIGEALMYNLPVIVGTNTPWRMVNELNAGIQVTVSIANFKNAILQILSNYTNYEEGTKKCTQLLHTLDASHNLLHLYLKQSG
jgi:glycosyltransferase involved in cell wall biosynthesis